MHVGKANDDKAAYINEITDGCYFQRTKMTVGRCMAVMTHPQIWFRRPQCNSLHQYVTFDILRA